MTYKVRVNEEQFITICNDELKGSEFFKPGMHIIEAPEGYPSKPLIGYDNDGISHYMDELTVIVENHVKKHFKICSD